MPTRSTEANLCFRFMGEADGFGTAKQFCTDMFCGF